ncbi:hypothetical protein EMCG_09768 [[Emmonsia] crescens]|uniref:Uncharacterized protein n=1 Tax=[Emmonsia] crescens TaxID=73230 RepID=A0A0G2I0X6_9EURO|nr:hypothetical protein EMCG_09768 [Emmonsia crescens UAMH 3008]
MILKLWFYVSTLIEYAKVIPPFPEGDTNLKVVPNTPNRPIITWELVRIAQSASAVHQAHENIIYGNLILGLFCGNLPLGQGVAYDALLKPGNNTISGDGRIDIKSAIANL